MRELYVYYRAKEQDSQALRQAVRAWQAELASRFPGLVARLLFGMVNSIVEWYRPGGAEDADQIAADVLAVAVGGLRLRGQLASGSLETSVSTS